MAEGRMLKRKISTDWRVAQLSVHSALLYTWSISHLDREGRMDGAPVAVRGTVVPYTAIQHPDEWTDGHVAAYITEWTQTLGQDGHPDPLVHWYCVRGLWVCHFPGFEKNQKIRFDRESPSRFPAPPGDLLSSIVPTIAPPAVAAAPAVGPADAAPLPGADPDTLVPDASPGPLGERLFADPLDPSAVTGPNARNAAFEPDPGQIRTQVEVKVQLQEPHLAAAERDDPGARARERRPLETVMGEFQTLFAAPHRLADVKRERLRRALEALGPDAAIRLMVERKIEGAKPRSLAFFLAAFEERAAELRAGMRADDRLAEHVAARTPEARVEGWWNAIGGRLLDDDFEDVLSEVEGWTDEMRDAARARRRRSEAKVA